jgi:hypothetical protein
MQKWQHCKLEGNRVSFLGASGVFNNKADAYIGERSAWHKLEEEGWQLVSAVPGEDGETVFYFKRPAPPDK